MKYQEPINADGKTALYEACSSPFMTEQEIINLIDSYPEKDKTAILNQRVQKPPRFNNINPNANISFSGYNIGDTPLHAAIEMNRPNLVKKLLSAGADPNIGNDEGKTPIYLAIETLNTLMVEDLLKAGAKLDIQNRDFDTPMMVALDIASENQNKDIKKIVKLLRKAEIEVDGHEIAEISKTMFDRFRSMLNKKISPSSIVKIDHKEIPVIKARKAPPMPEAEILASFLQEEKDFKGTPNTGSISGSLTIVESPALTVVKVDREKRTKANLRI